jgi:ribonuclease HI
MIDFLKNILTFVLNNLYFGMKNIFYDFTVYTDGSCMNNGDKNNRGGWGYVLISSAIPGHSMSSGKATNTTNNRMEITAVLEALKRCPNNSLVKVITDSQYVIGTMTKNWKRNKNTDLWSLLDKEVQRMKCVDFEWVKGHNGNEYNELADNLASSK